MSESDDEISLDSEEDVSGGQYSLDSSPRNRITRESAQAICKQPHSASDYLYSDVSSSMETIVGAHTNAAQRPANANYRYPVQTEDDEYTTDSGASSEYSSSQVGTSHGANKVSSLSDLCLFPFFKFRYLLFSCNLEAYFSVKAIRIGWFS